jgi:hypothetical protein
LLALDNQYSAKTAVGNAARFVREQVDPVIELQTHEHAAAPVISATLMKARIH